MCYVLTKTVPVKFFHYSLKTLQRKYKRAYIVRIVLKLCQPVLTVEKIQLNFTDV